jgi:hypothetical protein
MKTLMFKLPITGRDTIDRFESGVAAQRWTVLPRDDSDSLTILAHLDPPDDRSIEWAQIIVKIAPFARSSGGGRE